MNTFHNNQPMAVASTCRVDRACALVDRDSSHDGVGLVGSTWKPSIHTWEGDSATYAIEVKVTRH